MGQALDAVITQIKKVYGEGAIMRFSEKPVQDIKAISTSLLSLDIALGIGGIPRGRSTEIYGTAGDGKTTLALHFMAEAQKAGGTVAYIDTESALDEPYARALGVDVDAMFISQPDCGEEAMSITEALIRSGECDAVVVDSVDRCTPKAVIDGEIGDSHPAALARLMSQSMRMLTSVTARSNTALVFINQIRHLIMRSYGPNETTSGGEAMKFYPSVRINMRRIGTIKNNDDEIVGAQTKIEIVKNKCAAPYKKVEAELIFGEGFSRAGDLINLAVQAKVMEVSGASHRYNGNMIGRSRARTIEFLKDPENEAIAKQIEMDVRRAKGMTE